MRKTSLLGALAVCLLPIFTLAIEVTRVNGSVVSVVNAEVKFESRKENALTIPYLEFADGTTALISAYSGVDHVICRAIGVTPPEGNLLRDLQWGFGQKMQFRRVVGLDLYMVQKNGNSIEEVKVPDGHQLIQFMDCGSSGDGQ